MNVIVCVPRAMKKIKYTSFGAVFSNHVVMTFFIKRDSHIKYYIWMSHLIYNFYFFNKIDDTFFGYTLTTKSLHSNWCSHPLCFKNFSITTSPNKISFIIEFEIRIINIKSKPIILKYFHQELI